LVDTIDVVAVSRYEPTVSASLYDALTIRDAGISITLDKSSDRPLAAVGDLVIYSIAYTASGIGSASQLEITDAIPVGASYVPGTLRVNRVSATDPDGDDAGFFDVPGNRVVFRIGTIAAGQRGLVSFQVRVDR
jgi:uncharacterized repeat protein (TIGR01451 family)